MRSLIFASTQLRHLSFTGNEEFHLRLFRSMSIKQSMTSDGSVSSSQSNSGNGSSTTSNVIDVISQLTDFELTWESSHYPSELMFLNVWNRLSSLKRLTLNGSSGCEGIGVIIGSLLKSKYLDQLESLTFDEYDTSAIESLSEFEELKKLKPSLVIREVRIRF